MYINVNFVRGGDCFLSSLSLSHLSATPFYWRGTVTAVPVVRCAFLLGTCIISFIVINVWGFVSPPLHYFYSRRCSYILTKSKRCALQFFACVFLSNTSRSALTFFAYRRFLIIYVFLYTLFILILFAAPLSGSELVVWFADGRSSLGTPDLATPDGLAPTAVLVQGSMLRPRRGPSIDRAFTTGRNVFAR